MRAFSMPLRVVAMGATTALIGIGSAMPAFAADGDVAVVNTETVQVYTSPSGDVDEQRIYEQLSFTGNGTVDVKNPVSVDGLRNLDGFGGFEVDEGNQVAQVEVDGEERLRTVSDFNGDLPLTVSIKYYLDGDPVEPSDIVGESGNLEVKYTVKNVTGVDQEVTFDDGKGGTVTKTVAVPIPMVGSLSTTLPSNFTDVKSDQANMAGDGRGATKLSFTMTLFPPIGSDTAEFGYTANISDGVVPPATISALPVNPLESPSFAAAGESYQGGAETGIELTDGASQIDANLLKLRDGAGVLLAGLIKLRDGAQELEAGLAGEASPGANLLADGADELSSGLGLINSGSLRLAEGTGEASAGSARLDAGANELAAGLQSAEAKAPELIDGLQTLRGGLVQVDDGLGKLYRGIGDVPNDEKYQKLLDGIQAMLDGVGTKTDVGSLTWAVNEVRTALETEALPGIELMQVGANCINSVIADLLAGAAPAGPSTCYPAGHPAIPPLSPPSSPADGLRALILSALRTNAGLPVAGGLSQLKDRLTSVNPADPGAIVALATVECGLDSTSLASTDSILGMGCSTLRPGNVGLAQGLAQVNAGVPLLVNTIIATVQGAVGTGSDAPKDETLRGGMSGLIDGADQLLSGGDQLLEGLGLLSDGAGRLSDGTGELSGGLGRLDDGANQLADGTSKAADGSGQLADGANKLADGLKDAADGSGLLAGGLEKAADGAPALEDGAQRLSDEGTSKLVEAGKSTAQTYGELYAVIEAGAERADAEKMAFGAPEGALGLTAYTYEIRGDDGESGRNIARGLGGLALLSAGAGAFALRRRLI